MALAGMILGYVFTALFIVYFGIVGLSVMIALGNQPKSVFTTITSQLVTEQATNSADQTTNAPDQSTPAPATTTSPDQSTNSAPASTNSPSTNAPDSSTNATPVNK
jgi:Flp pilus assembly protein TadG